MSSWGRQSRPKNGPQFISRRRTRNSCGGLSIRYRGPKRNIPPALLSSGGKAPGEALITMERLYEENSFLTDFDAQVLTCAPGKGGYEVTLDLSLIHI